MSAALRGAGWVLLVAGVAVLGWLGWSLVGTNSQTQVAQAELRENWNDALGGEEELEDWDLSVDEAAYAADAEPAGSLQPDNPTITLPDGAADAAPAPAGEAVAAIVFRRPGEAEPLLHDEPLIVVSGTSAADLQLGPGHYPHSALPGAPGNFAVAGHRTTYGAPFFHLDRLKPGDVVEVTDRAGVRHAYTIVRTEIVAPSDTWVLGDDPLGTGRPTITLTTCHPRFSDAQRLIVFGELTT